LTRKHDTVKPVDGKSSRLCSFSIMAVADVAAGLVALQIRLASLVSAYFFAV